jgi:predicted transcriptional regulator
VSRQRDGGRFFYRPTVTRVEVVTSEVESLLDRFFGGRMQRLVAHFADNSKLTDDDVRELQAILERLNAK